MLEAGRTSPGRTMALLRITLGAVVGVIFVMLVLRNVDLAKVGEWLAQATITPLVVAFLAFAADFVLRAVRFWMMLLSTTGQRLPLCPTIAPFIASFGMSDILPLRLGDGFRVLWFSRRFGIPAGTVVGTMIVERILDLVTIVMLGGAALALVGVSAQPTLLLNFQIALIVALGGGFTLLFAPALLCMLLERLLGRFAFKPIHMLIGALRATSAAVLRIGSWRKLAMLTLMSLLLWLLESVVVLGVWVSLGGSFGELLKPFLAFAFSTLGTLVPSLPGHFGPFEFFGVQAFTLVGVDATFAAAVILLAHLILWAPTAIFGVVWLLIGVAPARRAPGEAGSFTKAV